MALPPHNNPQGEALWAAGEESPLSAGLGSPHASAEDDTHFSQISFMSAKDF